MPTLRQPKRLERHHLCERRCDVYQSHRRYVRPLWTINLMIFFILTANMSVLYAKNSILLQKQSILEASAMVWGNFLKVLFGKTPLLYCHQITKKLQACTVVGIPSMYSQCAVTQISQQNQASSKVYIHYTWNKQQIICLPILLVNIILCNLYDINMYSPFTILNLKSRWKMNIHILPNLNAWNFMMLISSCANGTFIVSHKFGGKTFLYYQDVFIIYQYIVRPKCILKRPDTDDTGDFQNAYPSFENTVIILLSGNSKIAI